MGAPSNLEQPEWHELLAASSPGTPEFFGSLLAYAQELAPALPINRVVFQSVLLCILAGNRSLVLRTRDEDVALLANTTAYVSRFRSRDAHMHSNLGTPALSPAIDIESAPLHSFVRPVCQLVSEIMPPAARRPARIRHA